MAHISDRKRYRSTTPVAAPQQSIITSVIMPARPGTKSCTNGTEAAAASDAPAQAPHTEAPAAAQPAAPAVPTLPQTGTTGWMAGVLASLSSLLLACGWFFTRKSKHS